jgi:hypothetical protein
VNKNVEFPQTKICEKQCGINSHEQKHVKNNFHQQKILKKNLTKKIVENFLNKKSYLDNKII